MKGSDVTNKHLKVTCAIIEQDGLVLAAQRSNAMSMPLKWEFPGGKIKLGETPEQCLKREIVEELSIKVGAHYSLPQMTHEYPNFNITLYPFICSILSGTIVLREHAAIAWLPKKELAVLDWADADLLVLKSYQALGEQLIS